MSTKFFAVAVAYAVPGRDPLAWVDVVETLSENGARDTAREVIRARAGADAGRITFHDFDVMELAQLRARET